MVVDTYLVTVAIPPGSFGNASTEGRARPMRGGPEVVVHCDVARRTSVPVGWPVKLIHHPHTGRYWYVAVDLTELERITGNVVA